MGHLFPSSWTPTSLFRSPKESALSVPGGIWLGDSRTKVQSSGYSAALELDNLDLNLEDTLLWLCHRGGVIWLSMPQVTME